MNVGSSVDSCSELEGCDEDDDEDDVRDWLLLLVSLLKTGEGLLPLLWMGFEVQSSPGCFFWMSAIDERTRERGQQRTETSRRQSTSHCFYLHLQRKDRSDLTKSVFQSCIKV